MTRLEKNINIYEAKTHLSRYLKQVQRGEVITLCNNGEPVAQIIPVAKKKSFWEQMGRGSDYLEAIPPDFNEELSEVELPGFS